MQDDIATPESTSPNYPQLCPICGDIMTQQMYDNILCWVCADCGFVNPV